MIQASLPFSLREQHRVSSQPANASPSEETAVFMSRYYSKLFSTAQNTFAAPGTSSLGSQRTPSGVEQRSHRSEELDVTPLSQFQRPGQQGRAAWDEGHTASQTQAIHCPGSSVLRMWALEVITSALQASMHLEKEKLMFCSKYIQ